MAKSSITSVVDLREFFDIEPEPMKEIGFPRRSYNPSHDETAGISNTGLTLWEREKARILSNGENMAVDTAFESELYDFDDGVNTLDGYDKFALSDER